MSAVLGRSPCKEEPSWSGSVTKFTETHDSRGGGRGDQKREPVSLMAARRRIVNTSRTMHRGCRLPKRRLPSLPRRRPRSKRSPCRRVTIRVDPLARRRTASRRPRHRRRSRTKGNNEHRACSAAAADRKAGRWCGPRPGRSAFAASPELLLLSRRRSAAELRLPCFLACSMAST